MRKDKTQKANVDGEGEEKKKDDVDNKKVVMAWRKKKLYFTPLNNERIRKMKSFFCFSYFYFYEYP